MHIAQSTLWSDIYDCGFLHCSSFPSECQFNCKQMYFVDYFVGKWNHLDIICLVCSADRQTGSAFPFQSSIDISSSWTQAPLPGKRTMSSSQYSEPVSRDLLTHSVGLLFCSGWPLTPTSEQPTLCSSGQSHQATKGVTATNSQRFLRNSVKRWGVSHRKQVELQHDGCPTSCLIHIIIPYSHGNLYFIHLFS